MPLVERWLPIGIGLLGAIAALVLGMGQVEAGLSPAPAVLAFVVALGSVYVTDLRGWVQLRRGLAHIACLVAVGLTAYDLGRLPDESKVLALANLLLYLQCVQNLRAKDESIYWSLTSLSLIEVAVAAALNDGMLFGLLLVIFVVAALATQALFLFWREGRRGSPTGIGSSAARLTALPPADRAVPGAAGRDPLAAGGARRLAAYLATLMLAAFAVTGVLFLLLPRLGGGKTWTRTTIISRHEVGYNERVDLGDEGPTGENPEEVMRVRLTWRDSGEPLPATGTPLFRGSVLTQYNGGFWRLPPTDNSQTAPLASDPPALEGLVVQEVELEPMDTDALFAVHPVYQIEDNPELLYDPFRERLARPFRRRAHKVTYRLLTAAAPDGRLLSILPRTEPLPRGHLDSIDPELLARLPELVKLAQETVSQLSADDVVGRARALEWLLRDSGKFTYTLSPPAPDQDWKDKDPLEHFVAHGRSGHCELFASALVMMLRSVGIPARMVVGFKGGSYNPLGQFYSVQQLHAHAWVEAALEVDQLPRDAPFYALLRFQRGGWLLLDPTPASDEEEEDAVYDGGFPSPREMYDYARFLWANYVIGLDAARQQDTIYTPLLAAIRDAARAAVDPDAWARFVQELRLVLTGRLVSRWERWFQWRAGLLFCVVALGIVGAWRFARRRGRATGEATTLQLRRRRSGPALPVEFYRRLERLLGSAGLLRPSELTPREFAALAHARLAEQPATRGLALLPRQVAESFYRVRFGGRLLDSRETQAVEQALTALERALAERPTGGAAAT
jgi:transglutaminase-like putative cysteine protease